MSKWYSGFWPHGVAVVLHLLCSQETRAGRGARMNWGVPTGRWVIVAHRRTSVLLRVSVLSQFPVSNLNRPVSSQNVGKLKCGEPCVKKQKHSLATSERTCSRCGLDARVAAAVQVDSRGWDATMGFTSVTQRRVLLLLGFFIHTVRPKHSAELERCHMKCPHSV